MIKYMFDLIPVHPFGFATVLGYGLMSNIGFLAENRFLMKCSCWNDVVDLVEGIPLHTQTATGLVITGTALVMTGNQFVMDAGC